MRLIDSLGQGHVLLNPSPVFPGLANRQGHRSKATLSNSLWLFPSRHRPARETRTQRLAVENMPAVEKDRKGLLQIHRGLEWAIRCLMNSKGGHCSMPSSECLLVHHQPAQCGPTGSITEARGQGCPYCGVSKDYTASGCQSCICH